MSNPFKNLFRLVDNHTRGLRKCTVDDAILIESFYLECVSRNLRPKSVANYADRLAYLIKYAHSIGKTLATVSRTHIRDYIIDCLQRDLSPYTINGRLGAWRAFYNYATDPARHPDGVLLDRSPMQGIRQLPQNKVEPAWLNPDQVNAVLQLFDIRRAHKTTTPFIQSRNRNLTLLLYDTMLRPGEACRLKIDDVILRARTGGMLYIRETKTGRSRRVPLHADVARSLHTYFNRYRRHIPGDYFFCYPDGRGMTVDRLTRLYYAVGKRLGFRVTPYMFRHGGATGYIMRGGGIQVLQDIMGHTDIRTTRRYTHTREDFANAQHSRRSAINLLRKL